MTANKKPVKKTLLLLGGGVLLTCLCLMAITAVFSPTDNQPQQNTEAVDIALQNKQPEMSLPSNEDAPASTKTLKPTRTPDPTKTPAPTKTPSPTRTPTATPDPNLVMPGNYLVNVDLKPGIYRGEGSCYWERLKDASGEFGAINANDNTEGQFYVQVKDSDYLFSIDCEMYPLEALPEPSGEYSDFYESGMYLIGRDILPGIYRGEGSCYWERLKNVSGEFDAINANDNTEGQFYVQVNENDFALSIDCNIAPLEALPEPSEPLPQIIPPGVYLVGRDILPGTYQGNGTCYWERLRNVSGEFGAINANDNTEGQFYVQISQSDFAFMTDCEVERVGD